MTKHTPTWTIAVETKSGLLAFYSGERYSTEAEAAARARDCERAKPFLHYVVVRA